MLEMGFESWVMLPEGLHEVVVGAMIASFLWAERKELVNITISPIQPNEGLPALPTEGMSTRIY